MGGAQRALDGLGVCGAGENKSEIARALGQRHQQLVRLGCNPDVFHVFLYAPRAEKIRRTIADGHSEEEAEELVDSVDRERIAYIKHYFDADWPTRSLYHVMLNTAVGNGPVIQTILSTMREVAGSPKATDFEAPKAPVLLR